MVECHCVVLGSSLVSVVQTPPSPHMSHQPLKEKSTLLDMDGKVLQWDEICECAGMLSVLYKYR